jgi:hypothetical protein
MHEPDFDTNQMLYFDPNHEGAIVMDLARGMSMNEVCEYFGCDIKDLEGDDKVFLKFWYKKGRAQGRRDAVQALFANMNGRNGGAVALDYLTRFAEDWPSDGIGAKANGFNFKVIMDDK